MALDTIKGCYNASTGKVEFEQDTCTYYGCYVKTGVHAGQIAITISETGACYHCECNDTYYACFDENTGKFSIEIPPFCCDGTPNSVEAIVSTTFCNGCYYDHFIVGPSCSYVKYNYGDISGTHTLTWSSGCHWTKTFSNLEDYDFCREQPNFPCEHCCSGCEDVEECEGAPTHDCECDNYVGDIIISFVVSTGPYPIQFIANGFNHVFTWKYTGSNLPFDCHSIYTLTLGPYNNAPCATYTYDKSVPWSNGTVVIIPQV